MQWAVYVHVVYSVLSLAYKMQWAVYMQYVIHMQQAVYMQWAVYISV